MSRIDQRAQDFADKGTAPFRGHHRFPGIRELPGLVNRKGKEEFDNVLKEQLANDSLKRKAIKPAVTLQLSDSSTTGASSSKSESRSESRKAQAAKEKEAAKADSVPTLPPPEAGLPEGQEFIGSDTRHIGSGGHAA